MGHPARHLTAPVLVVLLALGGLVLPVASLPAPEATAVSPELVELRLAGVDPVARRDPTALGDVARHGHDAAAHASPGRLAALSARTGTIEFLVAGVTWKATAGEEVTEVALRVREDGSWGDWQAVGFDDAEEVGGRAGTEPFVSTGADAVQARVRTASGRTPAGLRVAVIDPGASAADATVGQATGPAATATAATGYEIRPRTVSRSAWGADESMSEPWPEVSGDLQAMFVHHTAGTNSYGRSQSSAIVRGIHAYHTRSRGWPDIGYQFLVDRFGRIFQGRTGAVYDNPIGAQAGGFNTGTIGVSAIGSFDSARPSSALITGMVRVYAWKAYQYGLDPLGTTVLTDRGTAGDTSRTSPGDRVRVPRILPHGRTNATACPGRYLNQRLADIRRAVDERVDAARARYGRPRSLPAPAVHRPTSAQAPIQWSAKQRYRWDPVPGAARYQILARTARYSAEMPTRPYWYSVRTVTGTSAVLESDPGRSTWYAVRALNSSHHRGTMRTLVRTSRETIPAQWSIDSAWRKVTDPDYHAGHAYRTARDGARIKISNVRQTSQVRVVAPTSPGYGRLRVIFAGSSVGVIDLSGASSDHRVFTVDLESSRSGGIALEAIGGDEVRVSGIGLVRDF
ncbi:N-acetylmuramoyl-L-alanine amidase [Promicromonospora iranensis]|uniref:N-acetylmuramoyl-L-alanine amidase n=1 Tax=Promicromonospora iranensis TaxID=1105144 RepID=UPI0023A96917|nr:N-acetylmuramoyl-L-alanine amidase [Promicromonospora iranensis]